MAHTQKRDKAGEGLDRLTDRQTYIHINRETKKTDRKTGSQTDSQKKTGR